MNGIAASDKIFHLLDLTEGDHADQTMGQGSYVIQAKQLSFAYEQTNTILKNIDLEMKSGQYIAIAGVSGSGKSTFAKVLMGMEKGYTGSLCINQVERKDINDDSVWQHMTYVSHTPFISKGSVRENLKMANAQASDQQMIEVLKKVNLYEFLQQDKGLDTMLVEGGNNFSGGQKQRLAFARALLKDSELYIFDEATSNIDVESEKIMLKTIEEIAKRKTVLMITHRLSTMKSCDLIYMISEGTLMEQGTHTQLMKKQGVYAHLFQQQMELEAYQGGEAYV